MAHIKKFDEFVNDVIFDRNNIDESIEYEFEGEPIKHDGVIYLQLLKPLI